MHDYHDAPMIYPPFLINTFLLKRGATMTKKTWEDEVFFIITIIFAIMIPYFKGGGRRPRRPGRTKFSQHSLSSRRKELTRTRQVVSVFIFMKTMPGHWQSWLSWQSWQFSIFSALAWHEWSRGEAQVTQTSRIRYRYWYDGYWYLSDIYAPMFF